MSIQAIETYYNGYRFRSRLEARWAVFFDEMQLGWRYEMQGFNASQQNYLPDFFVSFQAGMNTWIEIKPFIKDSVGLSDNVKKTLDMMRLICYESVNGLDIGFTSGLVIGGDPGGNTLSVFVHPIIDLDTNKPSIGNLLSWVGALAICPFCAEICYIGICDKRLRMHHKDNAELICGCINPYNTVYIKDKYIDQLIGAERLEDAYAAARSARFEHGETPKVKRGRQNA